MKNPMWLRFMERERKKRLSNTTHALTRDILMIEVSGAAEELCRLSPSADAMSGQLWPDARVQRRSRCASLLPLPTPLSAALRGRPCRTAPQRSLHPISKVKGFLVSLDGVICIHPPTPHRKIYMEPKHTSLMHANITPPRSQFRDNVDWSVKHKISLGCFEPNQSGRRDAIQACSCLETDPRIVCFVWVWTRAIRER